MNNKSFIYTSKTQQSPTQAQVVANWVEAAFKLHENYKSLITCLNENKAEKEWDSKKPQFIGQCPTEQLVRLLLTMQTELEKLLLDMDSVDSSSLPDYKKNYKKLASHTMILNRLNQQAQTRLLLTTFTSA